MSLAKEIDPPITMTQAAVVHVRKQIETRGSGIGVRLGIKKMGCSGFGYQVDLIDQPNDDDRVFPISEDFAIYVDQESYQHVKGTQMDFVRKGLNEEFEFNNPNVKDMCGCGESFNV